MSADSQLMTWLVRMVVPMRREYGLTLDLQQFVQDRGYASRSSARRARAPTPACGTTPDAWRPISTGPA